MVIKQATGNVGIGTESPNYKLHIHNPDSSDTRFQITNTTTGTTGGVGIQLITFGNDAVLTNRSNGYLVFETNSTERMRITSGSNVGIGYTSPTVALQVSGTIAVGNATTTGWGRFLYDTATNQVRIQASKDGTDSIGLSFYTQASGGGFAERMIISGSNVGIGTSSPPKLLTIYTADTTIMRFQSGAATTDHWDAEANQTARFYISNVSSGNGAYLVYNSASGWVGVSDARWKTNWTDLGPSLSLISQLKIGKYKMLDKDKQSIEGARWDYGIKAQELLDIIPDAVDVPKDENDKYGVLHNIVFYHAIKAIQELTARVQELENK